MNVIGVVLAGGLSSRMGEDKSQLLWQKQSLLEYTSSTLFAAGCSDVIISKNDQTDCIQDRFKNSGPLAGIDACLHHLLSLRSRADFMLLMPVDMPLMTPKLLSELISQAKAEHAVYYSLSRFPLMLPISKSLSKKLKTRLGSDQLEKARAFSIKQMLADLNNQEITIDEDQHRAFFNCNSPQEWRSLSKN